MTYNSQTVRDALAALDQQHVDDMAASASNLSAIIRERDATIAKLATRPAAATIAAGDSYSKHSAASGVPVDRLRTWNGYPDNALPVGKPMWYVDPATVPQSGEPPPPPPPPPPSGVTQPYFGACPTTAGGGVAAIRSKYGPKAASRLFFTAFTSKPPIPAGAPPVWVSYKPDVAAWLSGSLDSQFKAVLDVLRPGDAITLHHERDNDANVTDAALRWYKDEINRLYDVTKGYRPEVLTGPIFTGGLLESWGTDAQRDRWCTGLRGDLFGVDFDGVHARDASHPNETSYDRISYVDAMAIVELYATHPTNAFDGIGVAEFMTRRVTEFDPDGKLRAAWLGRESDAIVAANARLQAGTALPLGVRFVLLFDNSGSTGKVGNELPVPSPELDVMKGYVATNPS